MEAIKGIGFFFASTSRPQRDLERKKPLPPVATSAGTSKKSPGITMSRLTAATSSYDPKSSTSAVDKKKTPIVAVAKIPAKKCIFLGIRKPHAACKEQSKHTSQFNTPCLPNKSQQAAKEPHAFWLSKYWLQRLLHGCGHCFLPCKAFRHHISKQR